MNSTRIQSILQAYFTEDKEWKHADRRLVFWYDDHIQFQEVFDELNLPGIEKLQLADRPFTTKYHLLIESPNTPYLLYAPFPEPADDENWLLDLQKTGITFSADPAALLYADLGFTNRLLETFIRQHLAFFNNNRTQALQALQLPANTNDRELTIAMLSVPAKLKSPDPSLVIRQVLMQGLLEAENTLWQEITNLISAEAFWETVRDYIGFPGEKPSLRKLMLKILISHLDIGLQGATPPKLKPNVINPSQRAYAFLDREASKTGLRYYRLRQVDRDGKSQFSPVRNVRFDAGSALHLAAAPNPFQDRLTLTVDLPTEATGPAKLSLTDAAGRTLLAQSTPVLLAGQSQLELPGLGKLASGVYFVHLALPGQPAQHLKVVKE